MKFSRTSTNTLPTDNLQQQKQIMAIDVYFGAFSNEMQLLMKVTITEDYILVKQEHSRLWYQ